MTQPTKADLTAAVAKLSKENAALREQRAALYDIIAVAAQKDIDADYFAGYASNLRHAEYLNEDENAALLRSHAACIRREGRVRAMAEVAS